MGCNEDNRLLNSDGNDDEKQSEIRLLSEEEKLLKNNLEQLAVALSGLDYNKNVRTEIDFATNFAHEINGTDEFVRIADLLNENASYKKRYKNTNKANGASFASQFNSKIEKSWKINTQSESSLGDFIVQNDIVIYFPYREYFQDSDTEITVSYTPLDRDDVGEGFVSPSESSSTQSFHVVTVDDNYAQQNPTYIVGTFENFTDGECDQFAIDCGGGGGSSGYTDNPPIIIASNEVENSQSIQVGSSNQVLRAKVGSVRLSEHYDGIFAGGSEVKMIFSVAYKTLENGPLEIKAIKAQKNFTRSDINRAKWKRIDSMIFDRWLGIQISTSLHVYEADSGGHNSLVLSSSYENEGSTTSAEVTYNVSSVRDELGERILYKDILLSQNTSGFYEGAGTHPNWWGGEFTVYKIGNGDFRFTLPHVFSTLN